MNLSKQHVNHLYFVEGKTVEEIAKIAGITKQRMSQLMQDWGFFTHKRKAPICPWRPNHVIYYRKKTDDFICRRVSTRKRVRRTKGGGKVESNQAN